MGDRALNEWLFLLTHIWHEIFERQVKTSVGGFQQLNEGQACGPFIRFVIAAAKPLAIKLSEDAIRARVRRLKLSD
jgi:hypothetical protein